MDTKLTLNINKSVVEKAKDYAKSHKISLSQLFENYLNSLTSKSNEGEEVTPLVESLTGVISIEQDFDYKKDYADFLLQKYK